MGYVLNELANLTVDEDVKIYIFALNGRYREPLYDAIIQNFFEIARDIGDHAAVVVGTDKQGFTTSVAKKYLGGGNSDASFVQMLPALLITDDHPDRLKKESMRLVVPLRDAEVRCGGWHQFLSLLGQYARLENDEFLKKFEQKENLLDAANKLVSLKPGMFGISLNINEVIDRWSRSKKRSLST